MMDLKTRLIYWLIRFLLSLLAEETGGKAAERITKGLKVAEEALMDAYKLARTAGDEGRQKKYLTAVPHLWAVAFDVKQITQARAKLPKIKVVWPAEVKS